MTPVRIPWDFAAVAALIGLGLIAADAGASDDYATRIVAVAAPPPETPRALAISPLCSSFSKNTKGPLSRALG
jgi:hypothetical protein